MKNELRHEICEMLVRKHNLLPNGKLPPKVFVVDGRPYWFLNAAKRAAFGTRHPVEIIGIEEAYEEVYKINRRKMDKNDVEWDFNQYGNTYNGRLFSSIENKTMAATARVAIIKEGIKFTFKTKQQ